MAFAEYADHDGLGLAALVRERRVSARELVEEAIARIERVNPRVNAIVCKLYDRARAEADRPLPAGPFAGVPFVVKDLGSFLEGAPLANGSRFFARFVPDHDAELFRRYRAAGLVILGKTNVPELGIQPVCEPELFGPTHTPWKLGFASGGSSGGAAAAVAAGMLPMAHGDDGGGSLRIPASCCGLFALKPTRGRLPVGPDRAEQWWGLTVPHALTRSVRDSAALLDATAGADTGALFRVPPPARPYLAEVTTPPGRLRIAVSTRPPMPAEVHADCLAATREAAALLATLGHEIVEEDLVAALDLDPDAFARDFFLLVCTETAAALRMGAPFVGRRPTPREIETPTWLCAQLGRSASAVEAALGAAGAERWLHEVIAKLDLGFLLRLPGVLDDAIRKVFAFFPFTPLANVAGLPAMNLPLHWNADGLPIGTMITGRFGDEATLYRLAGQIEAARPWAGRRPPVYA